jgi:hypothetical protein
MTVQEDESLIPFEQQDILTKLRLRAEIRRKIGRTSDGKEDRIAATCEEAHAEIVRLRAENIALVERLDNLLHEVVEELVEENMPGNSCYGEAFYEGWAGASAFVQRKAAQMKQHKGEQGEH